MSDHGPSIKDNEQYEALREDGMSKSKAAAIANANGGDREKTARKGGKASPYEEWTKDELYERAQERDIDNRSQMNKEELITALRNS